GHRYAPAHLLDHALYHAPALLVGEAMRLARDADTVIPEMPVASADSTRRDRPAESRSPPSVNGGAMTWKMPDHFIAASILSRAEPWQVAQNGLDARRRLKATREAQIESALASWLRLSARTPAYVERVARTSS